MKKYDVLFTPLDWNQCDSAKEEENNVQYEKMQKKRRSAWALERLSLSQESSPNSSLTFPTFY